MLNLRDFVLWQPLRNQEEQQLRFELTLQTPEMNILALNDRSKLLLDGLPEDAESVELLIHKRHMRCGNPMEHGVL